MIPGTLKHIGANLKVYLTVNLVVAHEGVEAANARPESLERLSGGGVEGLSCVQALQVSVSARPHERLVFPRRRDLHHGSRGY